ncbi:tyrosine-type recombinase/integrase
MPQKRRPARLWLRPDTGTWFIKDGNKRVPTDCSEAEVEAAQRRLADYIAAQYRPERSSRAAEVTVGDIIIVYAEEKAPGTARPKETIAMLDRVNEFFGEMMLTELRGQTFRDYAADRGSKGGARRDLEALRAAINHYHAEETLDMVPKVTLPEKGEPRQSWLTRSEIAKLLLAAMGWVPVSYDVATQQPNKWKRTGWRNPHLVRLIMVGLYTGTRLTAILNLQWMANTTGGHIDLDRGVIYRKAQGERTMHNKRKTPVKIPPRLLRFLRYWHKRDTTTDERGRSVTLRYAVHYGGEKITKPHKAFRSIRATAGLSDDITPHVLRHTRATWLAQAGVDAEQAAASLGMTAEEFERTYAHASPDFQQQAANAF